MKKVVLTFGLIAGAVLVAMMIVTIPFHEAIGFDRMMIVGYTTMLLAFLLIYFGVRTYRDTVAGGTVSFGRAVSVGVRIAMVAAACYSAAWQVMYFKFMPDFMTKYQAHAMEKARADGETAEQLAARKTKMDRDAELYRNPAINAAVTFFEPLPVALVVTLVSAGMLSRRREARPGTQGAVAGARTSA